MMLYEEWSFEPSFSLTEEQLGLLLEDLGARYARMQGDNVQSSHCFLHHNNSATLGVSIHAPHPWNCFVPDCQKGSDIIGLVAAARGKGRPDAVTHLYTLFPEIQTENKEAVFKSGPADEALGRFILSESVMAAYKLSAKESIGYRAIEYAGYCTREQADEYGLGYDRTTHRLLFPVRHSDGVLAGLIGRCMLPNCSKDDRWFNYDEGQFKKSKCLMGSEVSLDPNHPVVVVEGPSDYVFVRAQGIPNVRATMGAEFSSYQLEQIVSYGLDIIPLFDNDKAGFIALNKFRKQVAGRCKILSCKYPLKYLDDQSHGDPRSIGAEGLKVLMSNVGKLHFSKEARKFT